MKTVCFGTFFLLTFKASEAFSSASDFGPEERSVQESELPLKIKASKVFENSKPISSDMDGRQKSGRSSHEKANPNSSPALEKDRFGQARLLQAPPANVVRVFNAEPAAQTTSSALMTPNDVAAGSSPAFLPQIVFNGGTNEARAISNAQNSTPESQPPFQKAVIAPSVLAQPGPPALQLITTSTTTSPQNPSQISPSSASLQPPVELPPSSLVLNTGFVTLAEANSSRTAALGPVSATTSINSGAQAITPISTVTSSPILISTLTPSSSTILTAGQLQTILPSPPTATGIFNTNSQSLQPKAPASATIAVPWINRNMGIRPSPKRMIFD